MIRNRKQNGFAFLPIIVVIGILIFGVGTGIVLTKKTNLFNSPVQNKTEVTEKQEQNVVEQTTTSPDTTTTTDTSASPVGAGDKSATPKKVATDLKTFSHTEVPSSQIKVEPQAPAATSFSIENVLAVTGEKKATVSWETTLESDSRLVLHIDDKTKIFVSPNSGSKAHKIEINDLTPSTKYAYEIIATPKSGAEISKFGSFSTTRIFTARYANVMINSTDKCTEIVIEDTAKIPLVGAKIDITGAYTSTSTGSRYTAGSTHGLTDKYGTIEFCHVANEIELTIGSIGYTFKNKAADNNNWEVQRPKE